MTQREQLVDELAQKLLEAQRMLLTLRRLAEDNGSAAQRRIGLDHIDELIQLGLDAGLYITLLSDPQFSDESDVEVIRQYCSDVQQIYMENNP